MLKKDSYRGVVCVWMGTPSGMLCVLGWGSWMLKKGLLSGLGVCVDGDSQWNVVCMGMGKLNAQKELLSVVGCVWMGTPEHCCPNVSSVLKASSSFGWLERELRAQREHAPLPPPSHPPPFNTCFSRPSHRMQLAKTGSGAS